MKDSEFSMGIEFMNVAKGYLNLEVFLILAYRDSFSSEASGGRDIRMGL